MSQKYKVYINNTPKFITENWKNFCSDYKLIKAAGGVVYNSKNQLLMIFRNGKWDLPKGKLDENEKIEECAIREVEEECGIRNLVIIKRLADTYHTYEFQGLKILKKTFWFKMYTDFSEDLLPQIEEGITKVEWVYKQEFANKLQNSYANIRELF